MDPILETKETLVHASASLQGVGKMLLSDKLDMPRLLDLIRVVDEVRDSLHTTYMTEVIRQNT